MSTRDKAVWVGCAWSTSITNSLANNEAPHLGVQGGERKLPLGEEGLDLRRFHVERVVARVQLGDLDLVGQPVLGVKSQGLRL